jgi:hypothetical protein
MLCLSEDDFSNYLKINEHKKFLEQKNIYRYSKKDQFLLRSQLDAHCPDIEGDKKVFDIKTRAIYSIRFKFKII